MWWNGYINVVQWMIKLSFTLKQKGLYHLLIAIYICICYSTKQSKDGCEWVYIYIYYKRKFFNRYWLESSMIGSCDYHYIIIIMITVTWFFPPLLPNHCIWGIGEHLELIMTNRNWNFSHLQFIFFFFSTWVSCITLNRKGKVGRGRKMFR